MKNSNPRMLPLGILHSVEERLREEVPGKRGADKPVARPGRSDSMNSVPGIEL